MTVSSYVSDKLGLYVHETYSEEVGVPRFVVEIKDKIKGTRKMLNYLTWDEVEKLDIVNKYLI